MDDPAFRNEAFVFVETRHLRLRAIVDPNTQRGGHFPKPAKAYAKTPVPVVSSVRHIVCQDSQASSIKILRAAGFMASDQQIKG